MTPYWGVWQALLHTVCDISDSIKDKFRVRINLRFVFLMLARSRFWGEIPPNGMVDQGKTLMSDTSQFVLIYHILYF